MARETGITQQKRTALSTRQKNSSLSFAVEALTYLAMARQANVSKETLKLFAGELLDFEHEDIVSVIRAIVRTPRREGETAFPDLGTLLQAVRSQRAQRLEKEKAKKVSADARAMAEDLRLHPEKFLNLGELMREALERHKAKGNVIQ
jgi:hypothetical protein